jgi:cell division protein FtsB
LTADNRDKRTENAQLTADNREQRTENALLEKKCATEIIAKENGYVVVATLKRKITSATADSTRIGAENTALEQQCETVAAFSKRTAKEHTALQQWSAEESKRHREESALFQQQC